MLSGSAGLTGPNLEDETGSRGQVLEIELSGTADVYDGRITGSH